MHYNCLVVRFLVFELCFVQMSVLPPGITFSKWLIWVPHMLIESLVLWERNNSRESTGEEPSRAISGRESWAWVREGNKNGIWGLFIPHLDLKLIFSSHWACCKYRVNTNNNEFLQSFRVYLDFNLRNEEPNILWMSSQFIGILLGQNLSFSIMMLDNHFNSSPPLINKHHRFSLVLNNEKSKNCVREYLTIYSMISYIDLPAKFKYC